MTARRSPRQQDPQSDPSASLSSTLPPPAPYSEDRTLTLIDEIAKLLGSGGWRWLIEHATAEYGSKAVRARLHQAQANGLDLMALGAVTQSTLAAALAVERLLNAPSEMLLRLRMEQRKQQQQRKQQAAS
jgi:hypothetical protein